MLIGPDSAAQPMHRDCNNWPILSLVDWPNGPEITLSAMIGLDNVTEELGATRVIPGSHRWTDFKDYGTPEMSVPAELGPGDALVYSGKVVHGGGANQTKDRWRLAMHLSFVLGWIVPEESSPIDYTDEELASQSPGCSVCWATGATIQDLTSAVASGFVTRIKSKRLGLTLFFTNA